MPRPSKRTQHRRQLNGQQQQYSLTTAPLQRPSQYLQSRTGAPGPSFQDRLALVPSCELFYLPEVINEARLPCNVHLQTEVVRLCLQRILDHISTGSSPREEQVRTLRRLLFEKGDTLLIARTGFGKSIIFHAFSLLTTLITLQIIPLSRLGTEQLGDIRKFDGARPCLITTQTKREMSDLLERVEQGLFTHILLGPEQASSKAFRHALKSTGLQHKIGLIAIDECHLIKQWEAFRPEFTMIGELRMMLQQDVLWFGCSATLSVEAERQVLSQGGFRVVGPRIYQTAIIRTSIDRPDITICVSPIPKGETKKVKQLYFLLDQSCSKTAATPEDIPKTIVFIDGKRAIADAAAYLQTFLLKKHLQYTTDPADGRYCVYNIIETYTATTAEHDRDHRYLEFRKLDSVIRIIIATTCLGMGINVSDVARVCLWNFPIGRDLGDFWQRIGRGGRGGGQSSIGYIFLPYWAFDSEGISKPDLPVEVATRPAVPPTRRKFKNRLPTKKAKPVARSRLNQMFTPGDVSEAESVQSQDSVTLDQQNSQPLEQQDSQPLEQQDSQLHEGRGKQRRRYWTKAEEVQRERLVDVWKEMINGTCHRRAFLAHLCEEKVVPSPIPTLKERCCSRCNPNHLPRVVELPPEPPEMRAPGPTTRAGVALSMIQEWATEQAGLFFPAINRRFPLHFSMFMDRMSCWQLAYLYADTKMRWELVNADDLIRDAPAVSKWEYKDTCMHLLLEKLQQLPPMVAEKHTTLSDERRASRQTIGALSPTPANDEEAPDSLAMYVARRETVRATQQSNTIPATENSTTQDGAFESTSRLSAWVLNAASGTLETQLGSAPTNVPTGILDAMRVLEDARARSRSASNLSMSLNSSIPAPRTSPTPEAPVVQKRRKRVSTGPSSTPLGSKRVRTPSRRAKEAEESSQYEESDEC